MVNQVFLDFKKGKLIKKTSLRKFAKFYLPAYRQAKAIELSVRTLNTMFSHLPQLNEQSKQVIYAHTLNPIAGTEIIPVPTLKIKHTRQQKLVSSWISSPNKVGRIANELKLKIEKYGIFVLDKSRSSDKQVKSFRYNTKAIKVIREYLINKK